MEKEKQKPFLNYIDYCRRGVFFPNRHLERVENPKISLVIPMYIDEKPSNNSFNSKSEFTRSRNNMCKRQFQRQYTFNS